MLRPGETAAGSVRFDGLPADATVTITYQESLDAAPRYVLVVEPTR